MAVFFIFSAEIVQAEVETHILKNASGSVKVVKIYAPDNYSAGFMRGEAYGQDVVDTIENIVVNDICWNDVGTYNAIQAALPYFYIPSHLESEMKGMANALKNHYISSLGRNVIYEDIVMINILAELYSWREMYFCSSAAVKGSLTQGGKVIATRSLDLENTSSLVKMAGKGVVEYLYINGRDPIISIVPFPGIVGIVTGLNPVDNTYFEINGGVGDISLGNSPIPWLLLGRVLLESGGSMEGMLGMAGNYHVASAFNPLVADEHGFAVMSGNINGWFPRHSVWDMPPEVKGAIGDKVGEDYIININIILTSPMFYHDYAWYTSEEIISLRDIYWYIHTRGIDVLMQDSIFTMLNMHRVISDSGGTHAVTVDFNSRRLLFSQAQPNGAGSVIGAWQLKPFELPFEW
jgi:hypothetical protein